MQEFKAFKFRIYPTKDQANQLAQFFSAKRWIFNHFLEQQKMSNCPIGYGIKNPNCSQKITSKIERSSANVLVGHEIEQATRSLVV